MTSEPADFSPPFSPPKRKGLGRGLASLFEGEGEDSHASSLGQASEMVYLPIDTIQVGPYQPRVYFAPEELEELAQSIRTKGVLQPVLVRRCDTGFELIAGERRLRASQMAALKEIPCRILNISPHEAFEVALLENIQRADLSAVEEAKGYRQLLDTYGYTQEMLAQKLGKSRTHITNMLRLLTLPEDIHTWIEEGKLTPGHARTLVGTPNALELAQHIYDKQLSVRETEKFVRQVQGTQDSALLSSSQKMRGAFSSDMMNEEVALARHLSELTGLSVKIHVKAHGGNIQISFKTPLELDAFLENLSKGYLENTHVSSSFETPFQLKETS